MAVNLVPETLGFSPHEAIDLLGVTNIFATKHVSYCKGLAFSKEDANTLQ